MTVEQLLKDRILTEYKSVRAFSESANIPYSTIDSIFKRGIANSSVSNILKICKMLDIDADALGERRIEPKNAPQLQAAAAHFDLDKLNDEGKQRYYEYLEMLTERFSKE